MASRWNQQWKRTGGNEETKSTRPVPDPGSRTKYPQVWPSLRYFTTTFILVLFHVACLRGIFIFRDII